MHLRERCAEDLQEVAAMAARVRAADGYPIWLPDNDFVLFLARPEPLCAYVAERDGVLVGHVALNVVTSPPVMRLARQHGADRAIVFVARLLVDPSARRQGLGARLLDHARQAAVARGLMPMLDVGRYITSIRGDLAVPARRLARGGRATFEVPDGQEIEELVFIGPESSS